MKRVVILGAGGFGGEAAWILSRMPGDCICAGFCDDAPDFACGSRLGLPLLGPIEGVGESALFFHVAVGNNALRRALTARAFARGWEPFSLIDPTALIAPTARIGAGCFIGPGALVSAGAALGDGVIVNHQATAGHDCRIGDFSQLCPGARVSGGCVLEDEVLMGSNAVAVPGVCIGSGAVVAAGAAALKAVAPGATLIRFSRLSE